MAWQLGAGQIIQVFGRARTFEFVFGKAGQIQNAYTFAHSSHFFGNRAMPHVFAAERMGVGRNVALQIQVHRALPSAARAKAGAFGLERFVQRRGAQRASGRPLLVREGRRVFVLVDLDGLGHGVLGGGVVAVAAAVQRPQVPLGLAVYHPLCQRFTRTAALGNAKAKGVAMKEVAQTRLGANVGVAIGRVGDGAIHAALDTGARQRRHTGHGVFDVFFQTLEIVVPQLVGKVVGHTVQPHRRSFPLIRPEDEAFALLAQVIRGIRVAQEG